MKLIREKTIKVNGADVVVRTITGSAHYDAIELKRELILVLGEDDPNNEGFVTVDQITNARLLRYVLIVMSSSCDDSNLGFEFPSLGDSVEALIAGFENVETLVGADEYRQWVEAIDEVNLPPAHDGEKPEPLKKK